MKKIIALGLSTLLIACGGGETSANKATSAPAESAPVTSTAKTGPVYRVAIEQNYAPFVLHDERGAVSGFDIDILNAIAQNQGFQVSYDAAMLDTLFGRLDKDASDIVASGMIVTEKRKEFADFSEPYYTSNMVIVVGKDSNQIKSLSDLKGKEVAAQKDSQPADFASAAGFKPQLETSAWLSIKATTSGKTAGTFGDSGAMSYYAKQYPEEKLRLVPIADAPADHVAFAVRKGNTDLLNKINAGLAELKANGTYDKLYQKWFS